MTTPLVARDVKTGAIVADRVTVASRRFDRAVGLLAHSHLETGEGLWITPCHGVHTWFMRFTIDVIAMNADGVIVDTVCMLKPWRMRLPKPGAYSVLELRAGTLLLSPLEVGDRIQIG
jgi:uncharacterized membrane protein (UPF0127 family)